MRNSSISIAVPATVANLGPGFDCIGMSVDLWNRFTITRGDFSVTAFGKEAHLLPKDESNLVVVGMKAVFDHFAEVMPSFNYTCEQIIPINMGLGSSSSAIVAGLLAGLYLLEKKRDDELLIELASRIEGHPDNVAPAILGGVVVGTKSGEKWVATKLLSKGLNLVVFCPLQHKTNTKESRNKLPQDVKLTDAVSNIGKTALLVHALVSGRYELIKHTTHDRLHEPYRTDGLRWFSGIKKAALSAGALGVFLAGSGPAIAAFSNSKEVTISYEMREAARLYGLDGEVKILKMAGAAYVEGEL